MNRLSTNTLSGKLKNLLRNFGLMLASYFLFFMTLSLIDIFLFELDLQKYQQTELFESLEHSPMQFVFLAAIVAPILEESIFRSLLRPTHQSIRIFLCAILYIFGILIIPEEAHWVLKYLVLGLSLYLFYYALGKLIPKEIFRKICYRLDKFYLIVWIFGAIIFGFVHVFNYVDSFQIDLMLFLLIFPRIIAGFFFGKVKLENKSLFWPILLHSMNNSMVLVIVLPFMLNQS